jgi:predicted RNase H-like HicB family nuclease
MELTLTAVFEEVPASQGGGFLAYTEELPGAITQGETLEQARENLKDAVEEVLKANRELTGESVPNRRIIREKISVAV